MSEDKCTKCNSQDITFIEGSSEYSAYKCNSCNHVFTL